MKWQRNSQITSFAPPAAYRATRNTYEKYGQVNEETCPNSFLERDRIRFPRSAEQMSFKKFLIREGLSCIRFRFSKRLHSLRKCSGSKNLSQISVN